MSILNYVFAGTFIFTGIIFILIAIPLKNGRVKMNNLYGFRIRKAFESSENWYKINAYGAELIQKAAWFIIFVGLVSLFIPLKEYKISTLILSFTPIYVLIPVIIKVHRFAREL